MLSRKLLLHFFNRFQGNLAYAFIVTGRCARHSFHTDQTNCGGVIAPDKLKIGEKNVVL